MYSTSIRWTVEDIRVFPSVELIVKNKSRFGAQVVETGENIIPGLDVGYMDCLIHFFRSVFSIKCLHKTIFLKE